MKKAGGIALAIGIVGLLASLAMDTSVSSGFGRVHNIGLINQKQNLLLVFALVSVVGAVFYAVGRNKATENNVHSAVTLERSCPFCAETIKAQAILCRFCGREVEAVMVAPATPVQKNSHLLLWLSEVLTGSECGSLVQKAKKFKLHRRESITTETLSRPSASATASSSARKAPRESVQKTEDSLDLDKAWEKLMKVLGRGSIWK
ncbi:hypothetical protein [Polaromonas sp.]|uniref:hypothetical protein n=1 Tax=Polaromonas sp. TaxID=1869339 RepID=UPI0013BC6644|nr:hypothetical protein [Polaromonas sp.]NDP62970.1 hypothetical protein [Polaromonas sp.]